MYSRAGSVPGSADSEQLGLDRFNGGGPDERLRFLVPIRQKFRDSILQFLDAAERATTDTLRRLSCRETRYRDGAGISGIRDGGVVESTVPPRARRGRPGQTALSSHSVL